MMTRKGPDSIDRIVGRNIRIYRLQKGLTQTDLADELGLTFQQVQKYEKGTNRVGSGRLLKIATFLVRSRAKTLRMRPPAGGHIIWRATPIRPCRYHLPLGPAALQISISDGMQINRS